MEKPHTGVILLTYNNVIKYDKKCMIDKGGNGMNINKAQDGSKLTVSLEGRLDSNTAPQLETELKQSLDGITELRLDFSELSYLSSAGLRVILAAQKQMNRQGSMVVANVNETIMEVFTITGFTDILTIESL